VVTLIRGSVGRGSSNAGGGSNCDDSFDNPIG